MGTQVRVTQRRSAIGRYRKQRLTLEALGIRRMHQSVVHNDTPQIQGMITKVRHLLEVETLDTDES